MEVGGVDVAIDYIKEQPELEDLVITPSTEEQNFNSSKYGFKSVKIKAIEGDDVSITPSTEEQNVEGVFRKVTVNPIQSQKLNTIPTTQEQVIKGLFDEVFVNAIEGQTLDINPSEELQSTEGVFLQVNVNPIQTEEITTDLDFSSGDAIEITPQDGVYIKKATINKDTNLLPENIKSGVSISGISGEVADTSDADATSDDILTGKTAYVDNKKIAGTYEPLDTSDATATEEDILLGKTSYVNGKKVTGTYEPLDTSDATAIAEDIAEGKSAYVNGKKLWGILKKNIGVLSSDYQQVKYLESTGTQYINTGVCPKASRHCAEVKFVLRNKVAGREQWAFGQWYGSNGWRCGGATNKLGNHTLDISHGFSYSNSYGTGASIAIGMSTLCEITSEYPMLLFAQQEGGNAGYLDASYFRIYECKIWEDEELIRDFVPCYRKSDGEAGMYDIVNNVFYPNNGTGKFIVGPTVLPYKQLKYIENTDINQYIDTGVQASSTVGVELNVQTTSTESAAFFGAWVNGNGILLGQHNSYGSQGAGYYMAGKGSWIYSGVPFDHNTFHKFIYDPVNNIITVDGTTVNITKHTGISYNLWMFRAYEWGENIIGVRISSCKLYDNGVLIRNYIPVIRKSDGVVCMYDLVEGEYALASDGTFIAGPEIQ